MAKAKTTAEAKTTAKTTTKAKSTKKGVAKNVTARRVSSGAGN